MKIRKRGTNVKRHTVSYLVGGKWQTRTQTVKMAKKGKIEGVGVYRRNDGITYIRSLPGCVNLYDLPSVVR
jgi:hypothetical protein